MERKVTQWCRDFQRNGSKYYKRRQVRRLLAILEFCFEHNPQANGRVDSISRKDLIAYWKACEAESDKVRIEKYRILRHFFTSGVVEYPPTVPRPKIQE